MFYSIAPCLSTRTQIHSDLQVFSEEIERSDQCKHHELMLR